jgi:hypothetical protein
MEITPAQFAQIEHCLPRLRGNVSLANLQVLNAIRGLYSPQDIHAAHSSRKLMPSALRAALDFLVRQFPADPLPSQAKARAKSRVRARARKGRS